MTALWPFALALGGLVAVGLYALVLAREALKVLLGLAILAKGATLSLLVAGAALGDLERAQALAFTAIVMDVSVTAVGLAVALKLMRRDPTGSVSG